MSTTAGFAQIAFCDAGTLSTTKTDLIAMGITRNEDLKTSKYKPTKIERDDHDLPNYENIMLTAESLQGSLFMFKKLIEWRKGNVDCQIIALDGTCFKFLAASNPIGIEPKLIYTDEYRIIQADIEAAFPKVVYDALLLTALTATPVDLDLDPLSGGDLEARRSCYPLSFQSPSGVEIFPSYSKRSLTIEPKRKGKVEVKSSANISLFDRMLVTANLVTDDASYTDYYNQRGKGLSPQLKWKEGNEGAYFDLLDFAEGKLVQDPVYNHSGTKNELNVTYKGAIIIDEIELEVGTGKGNAVADTKGTTGGTMTFGYPA